MVFTVSDERDKISPERATQLDPGRESGEGTEEDHAP
jgi:hypothetical protein